MTKRAAEKDQMVKDLTIKCKRYKKKCKAQEKDSPKASQEGSKGIKIAGLSMSNVSNYQSP